MPQYDVHRNPGRHRATIPFVVVVQSSLFDLYRRRIVVPLVRTSEIREPEIARSSRMNPIFVVDGIEVMLHPLELASVAVDQLGERIMSLSDRGGDIADALDEVFTRAWS
jgi:toxin CcdB